MTVDDATIDHTAKAGTDYVATSGTLTFNPGETNQTIGVPIWAKASPVPPRTSTCP